MQANNKFVLNQLKWKPKVDFNTGIKLTVDWYKNLAYARACATEYSYIIRSISGHRVAERGRV